MARFRYLWLLVAVVFLAGCTSSVDPTLAEGSNESSLQTFSSAEELEAFLASSSAGGVEDSVTRAEVVSESAADMPAEYAAGNVQHEAVDEADILVTDGEYAYTVSDRTLFVVRAYPGSEAEVVSQTRLDYRPQGLFLEDDSLLVIGSSSGSSVVRPSFDGYPGSSSWSSLQVFSVEQPEALSLVKNASFEGSYVDARLADGVAHVVFNSPVGGGLPLPSLVVEGVEERVSASEVAYFPRPYSSAQLTTVQSLDFSSLEFSSRSVLSERSQHVYMGEHLFLASPRYINEWSVRQEEMLSVAEEVADDAVLSFFRRVDAVDEDILSAQQKEQRKVQVVGRWLAGLPGAEQDAFVDSVDSRVDERMSSHEFLQYTDIAKLAVSSSGAQVVASGSVYGLVDGQFSFDERSDALRVVTTTNAQWSGGERVRESESHVYHLTDDLSVDQRLSGLLVGDRVSAARFVDDRLYLSSSRDESPFVVVDTASLEVLGNLSLDGFSRYLHPVGEDVVLGLGRGSSERGSAQGLSLQLLDVRDVSAPVELSRWVSDQRFSSSTAEFSHQAFFYDSANELVVIPVFARGERVGDESYNGALVFDVSEQEVSLLGLIDHGSSDRWGSSVERSFRIEELLYTKSPELLRINRVDDLSRVQDVVLRADSDTSIPRY